MPDSQASPPGLHPTCYMNCKQQKCNGVRVWEWYILFLNNMGIKIPPGIHQLMGATENSYPDYFRDESYHRKSYIRTYE